MSRPACSTLTLAIRPVRDSQELDAAAAIYERAGRDAFTWRPLSYFRAEDFRRIAEDEEVWLAFLGDAPVGVLSIFRPVNFIHCLYVDPDAQGLGIGRALVAHVRHVVDQPLTLKLDAPNSKAIAFYEATGWQKMTGTDDRGVDETGIIWQRYRLA